MAEREKLLEVDHIKVEFGKKNRPFVAVEDVSFDIYKGEIFEVTLPGRELPGGVRVRLQWFLSF